MAEDEKPDSLLEEAMDWLLRLQDAPDDAETAHRFEIWLSRSEANARAWDRARKTWQLMGEVPPVYRHLWKDGLADARRHPREDGRARFATGRWGWKAWTAGGAAAAFAVFLVLAAPGIVLRMEADHVTDTGESRVVTLEDGSTITLGAHSAIAAHITPADRRVTLLSGEAFFEVVSDPSRPFTVEAGGVASRVLGTAFNVQLSADVITVELARGSVGVGWEQAPERRDTVLSPGEMVVVDRRTGAVVRSTIAQDNIAVWRNGQLFVNDAAIGSVVQQLQRYHSAWIRVPDSHLAAQRVTGLYDLRDPDRALRALVQPYGGKVRSVSPYLRVLSRL